MEYIIPIYKNIIIIHLLFNYRFVEIIIMTCIEILLIIILGSKIYAYLII